VKRNDETFDTAQSRHTSEKETLKIEHDPANHNAGATTPNP
jgi:hypothetical protein